MQTTTPRATLAALDAVLEAGESLGLWQTLPDEFPDHEHLAAFRQVRTPEGLTFYVRQRDGRITSGVESLYSQPRQRGIRVHVSDVEHRGEPSPTAGAATDRDRVAIAKTLHKRVMANETGKRYAAAIRDLLTERIALRAALLQHIEALAPLGWRLSSAHNLSDSTYWEATLYGPKGLQARVTARGDMYVERLTTNVLRVQQLVDIAQ